MSVYKHVDKATRYAKGVVSGKIPACRWIILACESYLEGLRKSKQKSSRWVFDYKAAERACKFIEMLPHTKGKWARSRQLLVLEPWQCFFVVNVFGFVDLKTRLRKYRTALLLVPRKNGKSQLAAAIALYMLLLDGESGAEVYSGATNQKQAYEVFTPAKIMVERSPDLIEACDVDVRASVILRKDDYSKMEPIIGKPGDGSSPHCAVIDEYHEHETDDQFDTMETGMGARDQPLLLITTTAGTDISRPCYQLQLDAQSVLEGTRDDDRLFALIYTIDKGDDWTDVDSVIKANPNYGVSISKEFLLDQLDKAKQTPRKQSIFQTKHCNVWSGSRDAFFNIQKWQALGDKQLELSEFYGKEAYVGLDLASKTDIAAISILIPLEDGDFVTFTKSYLPEDTIRNNDHYEGWERDGHVVATEGSVTDFDKIKEDLINICRCITVREIGYDPTQATKLVLELLNEGLPMIEMFQNTNNFSEPMKQLDAWVLDKSIQHPGDPCMAWMVSNVTAKENAKGQVYPRKERDENKIDGVIALLMAINRYLVNSGPDDTSVDEYIKNMVTVNANI